MRKPQTDDTRRATLMQNIQLCQEGVAEAALAYERSPTEATQEMVERAESDLAVSRKHLERFELSLQAASRVERAEEAAERETKLATLRERMDTLHPKVVSNAAALIDAIVAAGTMYQKMLRDLAELREMGGQGVRLAGGRAAIRPTQAGNTLDGHAYLGDAVGGALANAFSGGPSLSGVTLITPSNAFTPTDLPAVLDQQHQRRRELIARAATFVGDAK